MTYKDPDRQREYQRDLMRRRRSEYMATQRCATCGSQEGLELRWSGGNLPKGYWCWAPARRAALLAECSAICSTCRAGQRVLRLAGTRRETPHCQDCGVEISSGAERCRGCATRLRRRAAPTPNQATGARPAAEPRQRAVPRRCCDCGVEVSRWATRCLPCASQYRADKAVEATVVGAVVVPVVPPVVRAPAPPAEPRSPAPVRRRASTPTTPPAQTPSVDTLTDMHRLAVVPVFLDGRRQYLGTCSCGDEVGTYLSERTVESIHRSVHLANVLLRVAQRSAR